MALVDRFLELLGPKPKGVAIVYVYAEKVRKVVPYWIGLRMEKAGTARIEKRFSTMAEAYNFAVRKRWIK